MDWGAYLSAFGGHFWTAGAFFLALAVIVTVHEYGHYIVGRWCGIHAEVFSLGFGPRLVSRLDRRGTRWQLSAIPLGGYVKFLGDANAASAGADAGTMQALSPEERRHTMHGAPLWARAATVAAGPVFNFILAALIFTGGTFYSGIATEPPTVALIQDLPGGAGGLQPGDQILSVAGIKTPDWDALGKAVDQMPDSVMVPYRVRRDGAEVQVDGPTLFPPRVTAVLPASAAIDASIAKGDVIQAIDGTPISRFTDIQTFVKKVQGRPLRLTLWRAGQTFDVTLSPRKTDQALADGGFETRYLIGLQGGFAFDPATRPPGAVEALKSGVDMVRTVIRSSLSGLWHVAKGAISSCNLHGALGIAETSGDEARQGVAEFIWFIGALSAGVGLLNLFPVPVLDGGHLLFHGVEALIRRPVPERLMNAAMTVGLFLVLALTVFGLSNDLFCD